MNGPELRQLRKRLGYSQQTFIEELGVKSRTTLVTWEKSETNVPRLVELAVLALEHLPEHRRIHGKGAKAHERRAFEKKIAKAERSDPD